MLGVPPFNGWSVDTIPLLFGEREESLPEIVFLNRSILEPQEPDWDAQGFTGPSAFFLSLRRRNPAINLHVAVGDNEHGRLFTYERVRSEERLVIVVGREEKLEVYMARPLRANNEVP